jgi:hypothetical protein
MAVLPWLLPQPGLPVGDHGDRVGLLAARLGRLDHDEALAVARDVVGERRTSGGYDRKQSLDHLQCRLLTSASH